MRYKIKFPNDDSFSISQDYACPIFLSELGAEDILEKIYYNKHTLSINELIWYSFDYIDDSNRVVKLPTKRTSTPLELHRTKVLIDSKPLEFFDNAATYYLNVENDTIIIRFVDGLVILIVKHLEYQKTISLFTKSELQSALLEHAALIQNRVFGCCTDDKEILIDLS